MRYQFVAPWRFDRSLALQPLCEEYLERISRYVPATLEQPRAQPTSASMAAQFLNATCKKSGGPATLLVCLDENGETMGSAEFADFLRLQELKSVQKMLFCVGGAYGLPADLATDGPVRLLALSRFTFTHELAMLVLLEQVYRARTLIAGHPYHHGEVSELARKFAKCKGHLP